jgi:hypothetical protein
MNSKLTRYWIEFDHTSSKKARMTPWIGVTAWTLDDALGLVRLLLFDGGELPPITELIENVDVSQLDEKHVQGHIHPPNRRGVWYPRIGG